MSRVAATVSVVTTDGPAGWAGVTVTAMSSVSADGERPTMLVCVNAQSPSATAIRDNGVFCVNVLGEEQSYIADGFAGRFKNAGGDKFFSGNWATLATGAPHLADAVAAFDCKVLAAPQIGTHVVFVGEVQAMQSSAERDPLLYVQRGYGRAIRLDGKGRAPASADRGTGAAAGAGFRWRDAALGGGFVLLLLLAGFAARQLFI